MLKELFELHPICDFNFTARLNEAEKTVTIIVTPKEKNDKVALPSFTCTNTVELVEAEIIAFFKERMAKINEKCSNNAAAFDKELETAEKPKAAVKAPVKKAEPKKPVAPLLMDKVEEEAPKEEIKADNTPTKELLNETTAPLESNTSSETKKEEVKPVEKPKFTF